MEVVMATDRFQTLKEKYVSVLSVLNRQHFQVQNMHVENDKLFIRATAPDANSKNVFWDTVKTVTPDYSKDFTADISVKPAAQQASAPQPQKQTPPPGPQAEVTPVSGKTAAPAEQTYTVAPGDTLSKIAKKFYGNANDYMLIFNANRDQLQDPDKIKPNQVLMIPPA